MTAEGFTRRTNDNREVQPVSIISVDTVTRTAQAATRIAGAVVSGRQLITIDCSYSVGEVLVTPAVGEQWYVERFDRAWRLYGRIPFNDPTVHIEPREGQVSSGSASGPLELNGSAINAHAPLVLDSHATLDRPSASAAGPGAMIYDLTLGKPIFSNGTAWHDAMGGAV